MESLTRKDLMDSFSNLGIRRGMYVVVHSSLRSLGPIEGGAYTVIDALLACVGHEGLLVMPTFTYNTSLFDPDTTPSRTGVLTEVMRKRQDAVRSLHPTHSVVAIGDEARAVCEGHHLLPGLGVNSPLDRVAKAAGGILLLGIGHTTNSTVHVGEAYSRVPYLDIPFDPHSSSRASITGDIEMEVELTDPPGCSRAFGAIESELRRRGAIRDGLIGKGLVQWMLGQDVISGTTDLLERDNTALLCSDPACYRCSMAHDRMDR